MTKKKSNAGRKTVMNKETVDKLKEAFADGANVVQACYIVGIHRDTYYEYCKQNPGFSDMIEKLGGMLRYRAMRNLRKSLDGLKLTKEQREDMWKYLDKTEFKESGQGNNSGTQILIDNRSLNPRFKTDEELLVIANQAKDGV